MNVGRPLKYKTKEKLQEAIDQYFEECNGKPLTDDGGNVITDKNNQPIMVGAHPPTVTGLALALGFSTRQSLLNYQNRKQFLDTITRAKSRCEEYTESRLYDKNGVNGAKFSLINNFKGWYNNPPEQHDNEEGEDDNFYEAVEKAIKHET